MGVVGMNLFFTKTAIGYSHIITNKRCQDYSASYNDEERTIITACDGHGGNVYIRSHLGAKFASEALIDVLKDVDRYIFYKSKRETVAENIRLNVLCRWNALVEAHMEAHPISSRELVELSESEIFSLRKTPVKAYGTTVNAAMIMGNKIFLVTLGDGGCFLLKGGAAIPAFEEDEDEPVANITNSMCQDDAYKHLSVSIHDLSGYDGALVCTDGMINPYQSLENFGTSLVVPAVVNLLEGKTQELGEFVSRVGDSLGIGDDVTLGILLKGKVSTRAYQRSKSQSKI